MQPAPPVDPELNAGDSVDMDSRPPFAFAHPASADELERSLAENGLAVVPQYLDEARVTALREEVGRLIHCEHPHQLKDGDSRLGRFQIADVERLACPAVVETA